MTVPPRDCFLFGCFSGEAGHYLYAKNMGSAQNFQYEKFFTNLDGKLNPLSIEPYIITTTEFHGIGYSAYSWIDYSGDARPGSNSILFVPQRRFETIKEILRKQFTVAAKRYRDKGIVLWESIGHDASPIKFDNLTEIK